MLKFGMAPVSLGLCNFKQTERDGGGGGGGGERERGEGALGGTENLCC